MSTQLPAGLIEIAIGPDPDPAPCQAFVRDTKSPGGWRQCRRNGFIWRAGRLVCDTHRSTPSIVARAR